MYEPASSAISAKASVKPAHHSIPYSAGAIDYDKIDQELSKKYGTNTKYSREALMQSSDEDSDGG